jgi:hypothetical protein
VSSEHEISADERAELERLRAETAELERLRAETAELERLRAEAAELRSKQAAEAPRRRRFSWRTFVSILLIVLGCVLAPVSVFAVWAGNEVSNTDRWVATVEPLIHDPAIQNVLTDKITNEITTRLNVTGVISQASDQLNTRGLTRISSLLTTFGPQIDSAVTGFIHSTVHKVITSPAVARLWVQVNRVAHQGLINVLSGSNTGTISTANGQIVLNLGPFIDLVKQNLVNRGFSLASNIPAISPTVALFQADDLGKAQAGYRLIKTLKIVLPVLVLLLLAGGVFAARKRLRALMGAGLGLAASMLVLAIGLLIGRSIYLSSVPPSVLPGDAAAAAFDAMVHFIRITLRLVLAVGLVVGIGAFLAGPSAGAVRTRSAMKSGAGWIREFGERRGVSTGPVGTWTYAHRKGLRIGALALFALIFVFWGQPTAPVVIWLAVVLLVVLGLIELIGRPAKQPQVADQT